jgi:hypothetical protein
MDLTTLERHPLRLAAQLSEACATEAGSRLCIHATVHLRRGPPLPGVHLEDALTRGLDGRRDVDHLVNPVRPEETRVDEVRPARRAEREHHLTTSDTVEFRRDLNQCPINQQNGRVAFAREGEDLVREQDARRRFARLLE